MKIELSISNKNDHIKIKKICKALSDLIRLKILQIIKDGSMNYGDISKAVERSPTSITNHMGWIRQGELIEDLLLEGQRGKMQKIPKLKITEIVIKLK